MPGDGIIPRPNNEEARTRRRYYKKAKKSIRLHSVSDRTQATVIYESEKSARKKKTQDSEKT
jgi:hypothetical protein